MRSCVGPARRVQRIGQQHEARRPAGPRRPPSSRCARPSTGRRGRGGRGRRRPTFASAAASSTHRLQRAPAARSGARRPALRYGKSMRATGSGATRRSMATQRRVVAARPRPRRQQQRRAGLSRRAQRRIAAGLGEVGDAVGGVVDLAAVVGVGLAQEGAVAALHVLGAGAVGAGRARRGPTGGGRRRRWRPTAGRRRRRGGGWSPGRSGPRHARPRRMTSNTRGRTAWASWPAA